MDNLHKVFSNILKDAFKPLDLPQAPPKFEIGQKIFLRTDPITELWIRDIKIDGSEWSYYINKGEHNWAFRIESHLVEDMMPDRVENTLYIVPGSIASYCKAVFNGMSIGCVCINEDIGDLSTNVVNLSQVHRGFIYREVIAYFKNVFKGRDTASDYVVGPVLAIPYLCDDEGCPHHGTDHVCINKVQP